MHRTHHRVLLTATAGVAALALGAAPAMAGSDGCSGDCRDENTPPSVVERSPVAVAPQPIAETAPQPTAETAPHSAAPRARHVHTITSTVAQRTGPRGAGAAGAGRTPPAGHDGVLALLAGGALVLVATGSGLVATGRRAA
jgi:hypothetical protein